MSYASLIYDYVDADGTNIIKSGLDQLNIDVKAKLNTRLNILEQMDRPDWKMPMTEVLHGDKDGLIAIRVNYHGIAHRLLGFDGPLRGEFTILAYCTERNNKYIPLNIGRVAFEYRAAIRANPVARKTRHNFR
jgi:hypothetical protein